MGKLIIRMPELKRLNRVTIRQDAFTAIELLIAMAVFSSLLTLTVVGFIQINKMYQQGLAARKTQEAARYILEDIARNGRESDFIQIVEDSGSSVFCTKEFRYVAINHQLHRYRMGPDGCTLDPGSLSDSTALISSELKLLQFRVRPYNQIGNGYRSAEIMIRIATKGTDDLLDDDEEECVPSRTGSQFCSVSELTSIFTSRGGL